MRRQLPKFRQIPLIERLWIKNKNKCFYCQKEIPLELATIEHRIPKSKGGRNEVKNYACTCVSCNFLKKDMDEKEFLKKFMIT